MTNLYDIFKSRDLTLPTKVRLVKAMVFPGEGRGVGVAAVLWLVNPPLLPMGGAALERSSGKTPRLLVD